ERVARSAYGNEREDRQDRGRDQHQDGEDLRGTRRPRRAEDEPAQEREERGDHNAEDEEERGEHRHVQWWRAEALEIEIRRLEHGESERREGPGTVSEPVPRAQPPQPRLDHRVDDATGQTAG